MTYFPPFRTQVSQQIINRLPKTVWKQLIHLPSYEILLRLLQSCIIIFSFIPINCLLLFSLGLKSFALTSWYWKSLSERFKSTIKINKFKQTVTPLNPSVFTRHSNQSGNTKAYKLMFNKPLPEAECRILMNLQG